MNYIFALMYLVIFLIICIVYHIVFYSEMVVFDNSQLRLTRLSKDRDPGYRFFCRCDVQTGLLLENVVGINVGW